MTTDSQPPASASSSICGYPRLGTVLVVSAPSGAGKSTLIEWLGRRYPDIAYSVSCTTRAPRGQERDGVDYRFMTVQEFLALRDAGGFVEWAEVHGNYYGTPLAPIRDTLASGRDMLLDVDVQGAASLKAHFPEAVLAFILPPSYAELERRLQGRGTDAPETIAKRLANAASEISRAGEFDYVIVNDDLDIARGELEAVFVAARTRASRRPGMTERLLAQWPENPRDL